MFQIETENYHHDQAEYLIAAYDTLVTAEVSFPAIVALVDAYAEDENFQGHALDDMLDMIVPGDDFERFEWLLHLMTGPNAKRHRWYREADTGHLRLHQSPSR